MSVDLSPVITTRRFLLKVPLRPFAGRRFQPTGFPDLGAATFRSPATDGESVPCLLVESPQSMANRMELTIWDAGTKELRPEAQGLSYVRVTDGGGEYITSSIEEAHRLNSVYIENSDDGKFKERLKKEIEYDDKRPVNRACFVATVFRYDVNSLLHGVFLESVGGRLRLARALSAFIEAEDVEVAASGGVKNDHVQPGTERGSEYTAAEGYGNVPFSREEYTAASITAYFNLDLAQIRGYGLAKDAENLLVLLGLYKIRALLDGDLRLRTACEFEVASESVLADRPKGYVLPALGELQEALKESIRACVQARLFAGDNGVTSVKVKIK